MAKKAETNFKEIVAKDLNTLDNTWFVKIQQTTKRGTPDFLCCINGSFVALELKSTKKAVIAPLQIWTLERIAMANGLAFVCYPVNWPPTFETLLALSTGKDIENAVKKNCEFH